MEEFLGKLVQEKGVRLVAEVLEILKQNSNLIVDSEVEINNKSSLCSAINLGDIDVLIIDTKNKMVFSLECKSFAETRNIKEMIDEYNKFYEGDHYIEKHLKRDTWIKGNLKMLGVKYNVDLEGYSIHSLMITSEQMFTPILKGEEIEIPFCTLFEIQNRGYQVLFEIATKSGF